MKKLLAIIVSLCMCVTMIPAGVSFAADDTSISDPYFMHQFTDLKAKKDLELPEGIAAEETAGGDGIVLTGKKAVFTDNKILIKKKFDFTDGTVGRIQIDALGDKGLKSSVEVYLDDSETPVVTIPLKNQMGKKAWSNKGSKTVDIYSEKITGSHDVYLRLVDESDKEGDKNISFCLKNIEFAKSTIPVLYFDIDESISTINEMNSDDEHNTECYGKVTIQVPDGYTGEYTTDKQKTQTLDLEYIRGRGNSTWTADKKPYKMKLDKKKDLFGMGKNAHWVLLANRFDNSFMRNRMTYWLGSELGLDYTPQNIPVEVVMNGQYYGLYFLTEQVRVGEGRVEIDNLKDTPDATDSATISGGYLVSMEPSYSEDEDEDEDSSRNNVSTARSSFYLESPDFEDYFNKTQKNYIKKYLQDTEDAIFGKSFANSSGKSYKEYMDLDAAAKYFFVQEFSMNGDAYLSGSTYLYKPRGS